MKLVIVEVNEVLKVQSVRLCRIDPIVAGGIPSTCPTPKMCSELKTTAINLINYCGGNLDVEKNIRRQLTIQSN